MEVTEAERKANRAAASRAMETERERRLSSATGVTLDVQAALERERDVLSEQARTSGRPENIIEKMVEGRLRKFYEEAVLLEQTFVIDGETKVAKAVDALALEIGAPVVLKGFHRFALGEGIERKEEDFAAEVAATLGDSDR